MTKAEHATRGMTRNPKARNRRPVRKAYGRPGALSRAMLQRLAQTPLFRAVIAASK